MEAHTSGKDDRGGIYRADRTADRRKGVVTMTQYFEARTATSISVSELAKPQAVQSCCNTCRMNW